MSNVRRVVTSVVVAVGVAAMAWAFSGPDGSPPPRPRAVESVFPEGGALNLRQVQVVADLAPGYEGTLRIDGKEVPPDDIQFEPALYQVRLTPQPDSDFRTFEPGRHCAMVVYWPIGRPQEVGSYRWCFELH